MRIWWMRSAIVIGCSLVAFLASALPFGHWRVDDSGISFAYARNLADGHGLVAQPGSAPVEGYSNPLTVLLFAALFRIGLVGVGGDGLIDLIDATFVLAVVSHLIVLGALAVTAAVILDPWTGPSGQSSWWRPARADLVVLLAGLLLALCPPYVVWVVSGLENGLYAAAVAVLAATIAVAVRSGHAVRRRTAVAVGALAGLAALIRPDGAIYVFALIGLVLVDARGSVAGRARQVAVGVLAFCAVVGPYLLVRRVVFDRWLANTVGVKGQGWPNPVDVLRIDDISTGFSWPLIALAIIGVTVSVAAPRAAGSVDRDALVTTVYLCGLAAVAYAVLPPDWMKELRFATPAWPLLALLTSIGAVVLVTTCTRHRRVVAATAIATGAVTAWSWHQRSADFRAEPNIALCSVAERYGAWYNSAAHLLGLDPATASVLLPDVGGTLLVSNLEVIDLAGLTDRTIGRHRSRDDAAALADYVLEHRQPTFVHVHGVWAARSGLPRDPRFTDTYVPLLADTDFVRRDSIDLERLPSASAQLERLDRRWRQRTARDPAGDCAFLVQPDDRAPEPPQPDRD